MLLKGLVAKMLRKKFVVVLCVLLCVSWGSRSYAFNVCLRDDLGRNVCFDKVPKRVISLAPSITETIYAVGGEDKLVAVTNYANYPPAALKKKRIGGVWNPNKELIVYMKPDLVFGLADVHRKLFAYLYGFGIKTFAFRLYASIDAVYREIRDVALILGRGEKGMVLLQKIRREIDNIRKKAKMLPVKPRVFFIMWDNPLETVGGKSVVTDLITMAGGICITKDLPEHFPLYSRSKVLVDNPDIILFAGGKGGMGLSEKRIKALFCGLKINAVKYNAIYEMDADILFRTGPRTVVALKQMYEIFRRWANDRLQR